MNYNLKEIDLKMIQRNMQKKTFFFKYNSQELLKTFA